MKTLVFFLSLASGFLIPAARADEQCKLVIGQSCQGQEVYIMNFNRGSNSANRNDCNRMPTICNLNQFKPWIDEFKASGDSRHGIYGPLDNSDAVDSKGRMLLVQDKFVTKCFKKRRNGGPWEHQGTLRCPKSEEVCGGGMVFNATAGKCLAIAPSGDTDGGDAGGAMTMGFQMVQQQNNHFSNGPAVDPNLNQQEAVTGGIPGLVDPSATAATAGNAMDFKSAAGSKRGSAAAKSGGVGNAGAALAGTASGASETDAAKQAGGDSQFATQSFGMEKDGMLAVHGGGAGIGGGAGGASWFGSGGSGGVTAGGSAGEHEFGGASRGLASSGDLLEVEDPADYFMRSDIDVSLFKRVTAQCRKKEKALVLAP